MLIVGHAAGLHPVRILFAVLLVPDLNHCMSNTAGYDIAA
jgi:hypothetical protein